MRFDQPEQALQQDLLWAICSPDLMQLGKNTNAKGLSSIADSAILKSLADWLQKSNHHQPLVELITERQPRRLGIYYEALWQYVLENYPGFQLVARNLAITDGQRTLGEMDFVYYCQHRQRHIHLETAVKFYLGVSNPQLPIESSLPTHSWSQWLGPGCKDRLDIKLLKMLNQQTRLSLTPQARQLLSTLGTEQPLREICLKGYFFYPLNQTQAPPHDSHPQHARGYWLKLKDINLLIDHGNCWQVMKKEQWLSLLRSEDSTQLLTLNELKQQITSLLSDRPFPIMVANMQKDGHGYQECERYFITPNDWPKV